MLELGVHWMSIDYIEKRVWKGQKKKVGMRD